MEGHLDDPDNRVHNARDKTGHHINRAVEYREYNLEDRGDEVFDGSYD
jgi:hypothetical protein